MGRTPAELEATLSAHEFAEYQALFNIQPFGPWADDLRSARICAAVANTSQLVDWEKRGFRSFTPADFMPDLKPKPKEQTPEQQLAIMRAISAAHGTGRQARRKSGVRKTARN